LFRGIALDSGWQTIASLLGIKTAGGFMYFLHK